MLSCIHCILKNIVYISYKVCTKKPPNNTILPIFLTIPLTYLYSQKALQSYRCNKYTANILSNTHKNKHSIKCATHGRCNQKGFMESKMHSTHLWIHKKRQRFKSKQILHGQIDSYLSILHSIPIFATSNNLDQS